MSNPSRFSEELRDFLAATLMIAAIPQENLNFR